MNTDTQRREAHAAELTQAVELLIRDANVAEALNIFSPKEISEEIRRQRPVEEGDTVRSYDFPGRRDDCYVEGVVEGHEEVEGCQRYKIKIQRHVLLDQEVTPNKKHCLVGKYAFPPVNGTPTWLGGFCFGVVRVD